MPNVNARPEGSEDADVLMIGADPKAVIDLVHSEAMDCGTDSPDPSAAAQVTSENGNSVSTKSAGEKVQPSAEDVHFNVKTLGLPKIWEANSQDRG